MYETDSITARALLLTVLAGAMRVQDSLLFKAPKAGQAIRYHGQYSVYTDMKSSRWRLNIPGKTAQVEIRFGAQPKEQWKKLLAKIGDDKKSKKSK